jgi:hypothetical protein
MPTSSDRELLLNSHPLTRRPMSVMIKPRRTRVTHEGTEIMDGNEPNQKGKPPRTIAEMVNLALESTRELVANFNKAHELRTKNREATRPSQPLSSRPSSDKSP